MSGERARAEFARKTYDLPVHQGLAEDLLDKLVNDDFDMAYSQDAILGHAFAAMYEWVIEGRNIPVVPIFVNAYLPPLPTALTLRAARKSHRQSDCRAAGACGGHCQRRNVALSGYLEISDARF